MERPPVQVWNSSAPPPQSGLFLWTVLGTLTLHQCLDAGGSFRTWRSSLARMSFKLTKSRSMFLKKVKVVDKLCFSVDSMRIPSVTEKPVTSLGKAFNCNLKNTASVQATVRNRETWLPTVD